jgi:HlyD family secretion protein
MRQVDVNLDKLRLNAADTGSAHSRGSGIFWKIISAVLVIAIILMLVYHFRSRNQGASIVAVETVIVSSGADSARSSFTAGGWVEPAWPYPETICSLAPGRIDKMNIVEGSKVKKGDIIAVLYKKDFEAQLNKAQAELAVAKARVGKMEPGFRKEEVAQARAFLDECRLDEQIKKSIWERSQELLKKGAISKEEADKDKASFDGAQSRTKGADEALKLLDAGFRKEDVEEARAEVQRAAAAVELAELQLSYADIRAPIDGKILELFTSQGGFVMPEKPAVAGIYDPGQMQVRIDVRQEHVAKMHIGQRVRINIDARRGKPYSGKIIRLDPKANLARDTVRAKAEIESPDDSLYPEMTVTIEFLAGDEPKAPSDDKLRVPKSAVFSESGKDFVYVIAAGQARKTQVTLGSPFGDDFTILSGLVEGDEVVKANTRFVSHGQKVEVKR